MFPTRATAFAAACAALLLAPTAALAADSGEATPLNLPRADQTAAASGGTGGGLVRTFVGLAIVLAVIYGLYWVLKQVKASRETAASGNGLQSLASVPLGTNRSMHLVRAGEELVLVGVSEQAVVPIRIYREAEARAAGLLPEPAASDGDGDIDGDGAPIMPARTVPPSPGAFVKDLLTRVQQRTVRS
jgi:flagellar protein FliO/FliZ